MDDITASSTVQPSTNTTSARGQVNVFTTVRFRKALNLTKNSLKDSELFSLTVMKAIKQVLQKHLFEDLPFILRKNPEVLRFIGNLKNRQCICCRLYDIDQRNCNISLRANILENYSIVPLR